MGSFSIKSAQNELDIAFEGLFHLRTQKICDRISKSSTEN